MGHGPWVMGFAGDCHAGEAAGAAVSSAAGTVLDVLGGTCEAFVICVTCDLCVFLRSFREKTCFLQ